MMRNRHVILVHLRGGVTASEVTGVSATIEQLLVLQLGSNTSRIKMHGLGSMQTNTERGGNMYRIMTVSYFNDFNT